MKKALLALAMVALLFPINQVLADPLIRQIGVIYSDRQNDRTMDEVNSGARVLVFMRTMPGIDETMIKKVKVKNLDTGAKYELPLSGCREPWPTSAWGERMWFLGLSSIGQQIGEWEFKVKGDGIWNSTKETRSLIVNEFTSPTPPANLDAFFDGPGNYVIMWNAIGPPRNMDPTGMSKIEYRVEFFGPRGDNHCAMQVKFSSDNYFDFFYDPERNRVGFVVPPEFQDQRMRASNIIRKGGHTKLFGPPFGDGIGSDFSRGLLDVWRLP
jgi:hypothetical protein